MWFYALRFFVWAWDLIVLVPHYCISFTVECCRHFKIKYWLECLYVCIFVFASAEISSCKMITSLILLYLSEISEAIILQDDVFPDIGVKFLFMLFLALNIVSLILFAFFLF